jgi:hypothetical protein
MLKGVFAFGTAASGIAAMPIPFVSSVREGNGLTIATQMATSSAAPAGESGRLSRSALR